jgi:hypothetical protein
MKHKGTVTINLIRHKFDMTNDADVEAWELMNEINRTPFQSLLKEFVGELVLELNQIEEQLLTFEKMRLQHLKNHGLRKQLAAVVGQLRKDRDELRQSLGSEAYQRVAPRSGGGSVQAGNGASVGIKQSAKFKQKTMGTKAGSTHGNRGKDISG